MSEEQLKAFLEKVKADTELQEKLNAPASPEAAMEIAKAAGFAINAEDIQSMQSESVELLDEELEGAAGGGMVADGVNSLLGRAAVMGEFTHQTPCRRRGFLVL